MVRGYIMSAVAGVALLLGLASAALAMTGEFNNMCTMGLASGKDIQTDCSVNAQVQGKTYSPDPALVHRPERWPQADQREGWEYLEAPPVPGGLCAPLSSASFYSRTLDRAGELRHVLREP